MALEHGEGQPPDVQIIEFCDPEEQTVRLLEISDAFPTTNEAWAMRFPPSADFGYRSEFIIVTPEEWEKVQSGEIALPEGWAGLTRRQVWPR